MNENEKVHKCLICERPVTTIKTDKDSGWGYYICSYKCEEALMSCKGSYSDRRIAFGIDLYNGDKEVESESKFKKKSQPQSRSCSHILEWCVNRLLESDSVDMDVVNEIEGVIGRLKS
jgi:hypothetical protein